MVGPSRPPYAGWLPMPRLVFLLRSQRGQTATEYLGMIAVVVAIIGVILGLAPDIGKAIGNAIKDEIDKILS